MTTSLPMPASSRGRAGLTAVACAIWFGLAVVLSVTVGSDPALVMGLLGGVAVLGVHSNATGGRWSVGVALALIPVIVLLSSTV